MKWYRTEWNQQVRKRKGSDAGKMVRERKCYETKSLTDLHATIRSRHPGARTLMLDDSIEWPFGTYAEIIARS
jgi:hypothetical protein